MKFGHITNFIKDAIRTNTLVPTEIPVQSYGKYDLKIVIQFVSGNGVFIIDDLIIERYTAEEKAKFLAYVEGKEKENALANIVSNKTAAQTYNRRVDIVKKSYSQNVQVIRDLKIKTTTLAAIAKTFVLVDKRNSMSDPSSYDIFTERINALKNRLDPLQKVYLDSLVSDIKQKPIILKDPNKKEGLRKFATIAGDVANLITGGQFKGVVNSIQGLLSSAFNINALKVKIPEVIPEIKRNGEVKMIKNPNVADAAIEIQSAVKEGEKLQKFFFEFFGKLKDDRQRFVQIVDGFASYASEADLLIDEINAVETKFFKISNVNMDEKSYNSYIGIGGDIESVRKQSDSHFDGFKVNVDKITAENPVVTKDDDLNAAQMILSDIIETKNQYDILASKLSNLFALVEADLKRENPFGKMENGKMVPDSAFGESFKTLESIRANASATLNSLKPDLKVILAANGG